MICQYLVTAQTREIESLLAQNDGFIKELKTIPFNVKQIYFKERDTLAKQELSFNISSFVVDGQIEIQRGLPNKQFEYNYFFYENGGIQELGKWRQEFEDKIGTWYYYSQNYYYKVQYSEEELLWIDTIYDPDDPSIILFIDSIYSHEPIFPILKYDRKTNKKVNEFSRVDLREGELKKEAEMIDLIVRLQIKHQ
mgnify:CR=1 FL=1